MKAEADEPNPKYIEETVNQTKKQIKVLNANVDVENNAANLVNGLTII